MAEISAVEIHNFRSILESGKISLNDDVTVLVGPNESGKTNFLTCLHKFRSDASFVEHDFSFYSDGPPDEDDEMISVYLTDVDLAILQRLVRKVRNDEKLENLTDDVRVTKTFGGDYKANFAQHADEVEELLESRSEQIDEMVSKVNSAESSIFRAIRRESLDVSRPMIRVGEGERKGEVSLDHVTSSQERLNEFRKEVEELDEDPPADLQQEIRSLGSSLRRLRSLSRSPGQLLVDQYYNPLHKEGATLVQPKIGLSDLDEDSSSFYSDFLDFAGIRVTDPPELSPSDPKKRFDRIQSAVDELGEEFSKYWSAINKEDPASDPEKTSDQPLEFEVDFSGGSLSLHITDISGSADLVSHRSTGFRHFLSFFIKLLAKREEMESNLILLDSPGVHLHPGAQERLRNAITEISESNQVVFSTHSPFMLESDNIDELRVIEQSLVKPTSQEESAPDSKEEENSSEVRTGISHIKDLDHSQGEVDVLAPVRTSIGASFSKSLFASTCNILVEGPTDKMYIEAFSNQFDVIDGYPSIPYSTNVLDFSGTKVAYLIKVLEAEGYDYVVLLDSDEGGQNVMDHLERLDISGSSVVEVSSMVSSLHSKPEHTIEDLFEEEYYIEKVADQIDEVSVEQLSPVKERAKGIVAALDDRLAELEGKGEIPDSSVPKGTVSEAITEDIRKQGLENTEVGESTLSNFSELISELKSEISSKS